MASTIRGFNLECGAFSIPVALRGASEKRDVSLDRALKCEDAAGNVSYVRVKQLNVPEPDVDCEQLVIEPLKRDKRGKCEAKQYDEDTLVRGVWEGDEFVEIDEDKIREIESLTTIDPLVIQEFISLDSIPWERAQASYYLAPGAETLGVLRALVTFRDGLETKGVAAVGKLMPKGRQKLAVVYPKHGGLMVTLLAYADTFKQVLDGAASMEGVQSSEQAVGLMCELIAAKITTVAALDEYRDDLIDLRGELIDRAKMGKPLKDESETAEVEKIESLTVGGEDKLLAALRESVEQTKKARAKKKPARKARGSTSARKAAAVRR